MVNRDLIIDREAEREALEQAWKRARRKGPELVVLWGRRRVGKTYLLSHFVRNKRAVFFGATEQSEAVELDRLAEAVRRDLGDSAARLLSGGFDSWEAALGWFSALSEKEPLALVLDEVPYLLRSTPGFASVVQVVWDHLARDNKLLLVLTGSAVGVIERLLGAGGALRGRPTLSLRLDPLDLVRARKFLPRLAAPDMLRAYAACGGYPLHLEAWDASATWEENLARLAFSPAGLLLADATGILQEELPAAGGHSRILAAIGRGRTRFSEIASDADQRIEAPLDTLVRAGFVDKALPIGAPKGAKPLYQIGDPYLAFWFSCLYASRTQIDAGQGRAVATRNEGVWQRHLGAVFEDAARAHALALVRRGELPKDLLVGRWWSSRGPQCEVDVLGLSGKKTALLGEARWQESALDARDVRQLRAKLDRVPDPVKEPALALWSRKGITGAARREGARGYSLTDMLEG